MGKGGGGSPAPQQVTSTTTTSNLPEYARPYFENIMQRAQAESYRGYQPYEAERLAGFSPEQTRTQQETMGLQTPGQFGAGTGLAGIAGARALGAGQFQPGVFTAPLTQAQQLNQFQMLGPQNVTGMRQFAPMMRTAQAQGPGGVQGGVESFTGQGTMAQFMSPFQQAVTDVQKREAIRETQLAQQQANLGAARQGTYGGARQAIAQAERERGLLDRLSNIQATGSQAAFDQAQRAFEQEQARRLQAGLQTQQLGTQTTLANLSAAQQANVQNQAARLQTQGLNADQALRAALANQQAGLTVGQQNLQAALGVQQLGAQQGLESQRLNQQALMEAQRMAEQSRQFGGDLGLRGAGQAVQAGQVLGQLGQSQQQADLQRLTAQEAVGAQQRSFEQQRLDQAYADFLRQRDYPMEQLGYYSNLLRGIPVGLSSTQTTSAPPPSIASQIGGLGLAGLSIGRMAGAFAKGGEVAAYAPGGAVSSPEELDSMTDRLSDQQLQMQLRNAVPGTPEHLMVAGELQARRTLREKANVPQANPTPVIADLLTGGAMPQMPQMPPQMQQQVAMLPENAGGVAALPAPNMENVEAMAAGGLVAFEDGGRVAQFSNGGTPFYAEGNRPFQTAPGQKRRQYTQEELDEARRLKELGVLGGLKEFVVDPVTEFFSRGDRRQDVRVAKNQAAYGQNVFAREGDPSGAQYSGIEDVPFSNMAPVAAAVAPVLADAAKEADAAAQPTDAAKKEAAGAGIPKLGDALALGRKFAGDTKGLEKQLTELPTAEKSATEQFDLYKKMGVDLDPYKSLKESLEKEKSEEGKAKTQAGLMALANFGFSLATQTGPFGQAVGKAGKETLPMYAAELKDLKKLSRERDRTLADIRATDSKMRKDVTDAGLAKLEKRREKLESRIDQINDNAARISGTIYGQQLASQTAFGVAGINKTTAEAGRAEARDDRLLLQAQELAAKQVRDDPLNVGKSAAQKEAEIRQLASNYYRQLIEMRGGKVAQAPAGATLRFDAKGNPIQ